MTYAEVLKEGERRLQASGIADFSYDASELLKFSAGFTTMDFLFHKGDEIGARVRKHYFYYIRKRASYIPLQHIIGKAPFYGLDFYVSKDVLVPRFDTELLVDAVLKDFPDRNTGILDMCTGSGCLAVTLKKEGGYRIVSASDLSEKALRKAKQNAEYHQADVCFYQGDMFSSVKGSYDVLVSNPPYISPEEIETLSPEVKDHDPYMALYGGEDGLVFYRRIAAEAKAFLTEEAVIYLEIGYAQAKAVSDIFLTEGYRKTEVRKDLSGLDRMVIVYR